MGETGYIEGQSIVIEYRTAQDHADRLQMLAADLVRREVAVIVTASNVTAALAAKAATQRIPIVFIMGADPVETGIVTSLSRPGGNVTVATTLAGELFEKRVELMHELVPEAKTIVYLANPTNPSFANVQSRVRLTTMADRLGVPLLELKASNRGDIENAFPTLVRQGAGSLVVGPDAFFLSQRELLVTLAAAMQFPHPTSIEISSRRAGSSVIRPTALTRTDKRALMLAASSTARSQAICPCSSRPSWNS